MCNSALWLFLLHGVPSFTVPSVPSTGCLELSCGGKFACWTFENYGRCGENILVYIMGSIDFLLKQGFWFRFCEVSYFFMIVLNSNLIPYMSVSNMISYTVVLECWISHHCQLIYVWTNHGTSINHVNMKARPWEFQWKMVLQENVLLLPWMDINSGQGMILIHHPSRESNQSLPAWSAMFLLTAGA